MKRNQEEKATQSVVEVDTVKAMPVKVEARTEVVARLMVLEQSVVYIVEHPIASHSALIMVE